MICFHFTIFVVLETTDPADVSASDGCDLLSFYYLCRTGNNVGLQGQEHHWVVICFHFTIFVVLETTEGGHDIASILLWFAFILLSLSYWKQPAQWQVRCRTSCDLLSFYYLCRTGNNAGLAERRDVAVVICFHFTIFVVLETTFNKYKEENDSCDLLSFYYLCRTGNNCHGWRAGCRWVVICFHFTIFVVLETTRKRTRPSN